MFVVFIILIAYIIAEFILFARGKSIGKAILGLQVVSSTDGKPFRFWKMFFRECFVKSASGSVFALGYIWILIDEKNRGWHDKILDSYVVDLKESERINYRRHFEQTQRTASAHTPTPAPAPAPQPEPEIKEAEPAVSEMPAADEPVATDIQVAEEPTVVDENPDEEQTVALIEAVEIPVLEVTPEMAEAENEETVAEDVAETAVETSIEVTAEESSGLPELNMSMKKEELLEAARARGIQVSSRATKAAIIEAIEKAAAEETE